MKSEKKSKRLAIVTPGFLPVPSVDGGGVERIITDLLVSNEKSGGTFKIVVYTLASPNIPDIKFQHTKIVQIRLPKWRRKVETALSRICIRMNVPYRPTYFAKSCIKYAKGESFDAVIIENNMYAYKKLITARAFGRAKIFFHLHNNIGGSDKPVFLCKYIAKTADSVWACSDYIRTRFADMTNAENVVTLNNSIDTRLFSFNAKKRQEVRMSLNFSKQDCVFMYVGRLRPEKGALELLRAFMLLDKNMLLEHTAKLVFVGDDTPNHSYVRLVTKVADREKNVFFVGQLSNRRCAEFMSAADCIIVPTQCEEAFGLVAAEAIACNRALIVSDSGELKNMVSGSDMVVERNEDFVNNLALCMKDMYCALKKHKTAGNVGTQGAGISKVDNLDEYYNNFVELLKEEFSK